MCMSLTYARALDADGMFAHPVCHLAAAALLYEFQSKHDSRYQRAHIKLYEASEEVHAHVT